MLSNHWHRHHYDVTKASPCTWLAKSRIDFLQCMIRRRLLRKLDSRFFFLRNVSKRIKSCHNRINTWCTVHCVIGGTQRPLGYAPPALAGPRGLFVPPISQCTVHHALILKHRAWCIFILLHPKLFISHTWLCGYQTTEGVSSLIHRI